MNVSKVDDWVNPIYRTSGHPMLPSASLRRPLSPEFSTPRSCNPRRYSAGSSSTLSGGFSDAEADNYTWRPKRHHHSRDCEPATVLQSVQGHERSLPRRIRKQARRDHSSGVADNSDNSSSKVAPRESRLEHNGLSSETDTRRISLLRRGIISAFMIEKSFLEAHDPIEKCSAQEVSNEGSSECPASSTGNAHESLASEQSCDQHDATPDTTQTVPRGLDLPTEDALRQSIQGATGPHTKSGKPPPPKQGPLINHYPLPQRLYDVARVMDNVSKAFPEQAASGYTKYLQTKNQSSKDGLHLSSGQINLPEPFARRSRNPWLHHSSYRGALRPAVTETLKADPSSAIPCVEPVDGDSQRSQQTSNGNRALLNSGSSQRGGLARGPNRPGDSNRRDSDEPEDPADPARAPPAAQSSHTQSKRFRCVYCDPNRPGNCKPECQTLHQYVSHLRVHHGGNDHLLFYCAICMTRFDTKRQRDDHDSGHCKMFKCVTEGCENFNTYSVETCYHPDNKNKKKNSQISIWKALHRLAHTGTTALPETAATAPRETPVAGPLTPANPPNDYSLSDNTGSGAGAHRIHIPGTNVSISSTPSSASATYNIDFQAETYVRVLHKMLSILKEQLDTPDDDSLELIQRMYLQWVESGNPDLLYRRSPTVRGLEELCRRMLAAVKDPNRTSSTCKRHLHELASDVLTKGIETSLQTNAPPQGSRTFPVSQSPGPMPSSSNQPSDSTPYDVDFVLRHGDQTYAEEFWRDFQGSNFDLNAYNPSIGFGQAWDSDSHQDEQSHGSNAPQYMNTFGDSAVAATPERQIRGKGKAPTDDSGYFSGGTSGHFGST